MDTVALLAWTAASLEDGDKHSLATSVRPFDKNFCNVSDKKSFIESFLLLGLGGSASSNCEKQQRNNIV